MFAPDDDHHRAFAVEPARDATVLDVVGHRCDVTEPGPATGIADPVRLRPVHDHVPPGRGIEQLVVDPDRLPLRAADRALGLVRGRPDECVADVFEAEPQAGQHRGIDLDPHRGLHATADSDLTDARDLRQLLREDRVRGLEHLR
jgi:hypothetical protein